MPQEPSSSPPSIISEGSVLLSKPLHALAKEIIKSLDTFFKRGSDRLNALSKGGDYEDGKWIHGDYIDGESWGGNTILFLIYPSAKYNPDTQSDAKLPGYVSKSGGYFAIINQPGIGDMGKIVLHLDQYVPLFTNYSIPVVPSSEYDIRDPDVRKKVYKSSKSQLYQFAYHEAQHAVKRFVHGWEGDEKLGAKYQQYYDKPGSERGLAQYTKLGDEWESIMAQIMAEVQATIRFDKSRPEQLKTLTKTLIVSPSFRKLVVGMLDNERIGQDRSSGKMSADAKEFFNVFWSNGKSRVMVRSFDPFHPEFFKYIKPEYHRTLKAMLKRLVEWWREEYPKKSFRTPLPQANESGAGTGTFSGNGRCADPSRLDVDRFADATSDKVSDNELDGIGNKFDDLLNEEMTFRDLMQVSDPARKQRAKTVNTKSLRVRSIDEYEAWTFSYKSNPSQSRTKSNVAPRHQGYIKFLKDDVKSGEDAQDINCHCDCTCNDYKYRWAYNNAKVNASKIGNDSWNKATNQAPKIDLGQGLCKHLIALEKFLQTKVHSSSDGGAVDTGEPKKPSNLFESADIYSKFAQFVSTNPEFDVPYEYEEEDVDETLNESFRNHKEWFIYDGIKEVKVVFNDGRELKFDIDYKGNLGIEREPWRNKAASMWKKLANEMYRNADVNEVGNVHHKPWYECFKSALASREMMPFQMPPGATKVTFEKKVTGYEKAPSVVAGIDPVNFSPRI
jgi:hypothetical protein